MARLDKNDDGVEYGWTCATCNTEEFSTFRDDAHGQASLHKNHHPDHTVTVYRVIRDQAKRL